MARSCLLIGMAGVLLAGCHAPGAVGNGPPPPAYPPPAVGDHVAGVPPGHGGVPPGHGGVPPGQAKKGGYAPATWSAGGPPPWAPAHGHRKKGRGAHYAYDAPYGIYQQTCWREDLGRALGAVAGGVAGYQVGKGDGKTAAVVGGTIVGAMIGGQIGRSMDEVDQNCIGQILEHAPPSQSIVWRNPQVGGQYRVTPQQPYQDRAGRYCREYQTMAAIGGQPQQVYGTACRQPDGSWQVVN
ncbi:MAG: glycine zipper 2TM domain-containing protein [Rhodospirillales bacterium]|nr:MAG: glycine zipper 2TM domain-containing protein [Rhodospirillales bacterium]